MKEILGYICIGLSIVLFVVENRLEARITPPDDPLDGRDYAQREMDDRMSPFKHRPLVLLKLVGGLVALLGAYLIGLFGSHS